MNNNRKKVYPILWYFYMLQKNIQYKHSTSLEYRVTKHVLKNVTYRSFLFLFYIMGKIKLHKIYLEKVIAIEYVGCHYFYMIELKDI